ncbi:MAG: phage head morphogenesis protein [Burkholderiaceae bacterium]|jgi:hypothetical protein|nr:phage head morphogenesis protein [Burkholderiaceae bacterium]
MATANEWLQAEAIRHAVDLSHYSNGVVQKIIATLNRSDQRLFAQLLIAVERGDAGSFSIERLDALLESVRALNIQAFNAAERELTDELKRFVEYELNYQQRSLATAVPVRVSLAAVSLDQVYSAALNRPFQGVLLKGVWSELSDQRMSLIRRTVAQGFVEAKTTDQIVRQLRGTRSKGYADGLVNRSRRDVQAVVRTAMGHYAGVTQDRVIAANSDIIKAVQWLATLDTRTSEICRLHDSLLYTPQDHAPIGHSVPWGAGPGRAHWCCRSKQVAILKGWKELGVDVENAPERTRESMDGQVPRSLSYFDWLSQQPAARQDEILGVTRGRLLRQGQIPMESMYTNNGRWLTLDELRGRDAQAFERAGV